MQETHLNLSRQTVKLILIKTVQDLFPDDTLKIAYSIPEGVFCRLLNSALSIREVKQLNLKLQEEVRQDLKISLLKYEHGYYHYQINDRIIKTIYPAHDHTSLVEPFQVIPFYDGFIVNFSQRDQDLPLILPEKLAATYEESQKGLENINLELVSDINEYISSGRTLELISLAEALQEKKIVNIADMILSQRRRIRVILISGPSSSGKTSFTRRLAIQLRVNGLKPISLGVDDYFVEREQTPRDENGNYDFDTIKALDVALLQKHIKELIKGETVETPLFDFLTGTRKKETKTMRLNDDEILIIEGIHALNPKLIPSGNKNVFYKIYISALFELNVDLINRTPTTEVRMIRRMVRDARSRGFSPENTLKQWPSVRRGENNNVFKYQEEADVMINSSLIYEMNALSALAPPILEEIKKDSPYYDIKERLISLLSFFQPMDTAQIPFNSILREFIGNSICFPE
ncbi:uridine kinase family protein [Dehalobacterium formicoaceticum]|uniref:Nucleoside kinase n=1 Tax=Dehalobacterium formicoaceticum TaxID=51515 RepID=A0ABT1Y411_9FIRM|nr:nucleoside kinase [Dehalobacterium formicoaceticum]MCR6545613.1 nucleoside kinase [Dehalobacterium formicoaceticum]